MAAKKIQVTKKYLNNSRNSTTANDYPDTVVQDGNVVPEDRAVNPGVESNPPK